MSNDGHSTQQQNLSQTRPIARGYRILSLDGGGVTGFSSLLILKQLLRRIGSEGSLYPYQHFDLICGTSTGGLIAILLAVLHLEIDDAIATYLELMRVCEASLQQWWWSRDSRLALTLAIQDILRKHGIENSSMVDPTRKMECKCFVTTATLAGGKTPIRLIRSYEDPTKNIRLHAWTIQDAALAAFGAPVYFRSHRILHENQTYQYEDARFHGLNNPTIVAWDEYDLLNPNVPHCIINLGSMAPNSSESPPSTSSWVFSLLKSPWTASKTANNMVDEIIGESNSQIHEKMERLTRKLKPNPYSRFAPDLGSMRNASLSYKSSLNTLADIVTEYCAALENNSRLDACTKMLISL